VVNAPSTPHGVFTSTLVHPKPGPLCGRCLLSEGGKKAQNRIGGRANGKTPGNRLGKIGMNAPIDMERLPKTRNPSIYIDNVTSIASPSDRAPLKVAPFGGKPGPLCGRRPYGTHVGIQPEKD